MFVVRLRRPREAFDLRAFPSKVAARARFRTAQRELIDGDVAECALFEIRTTDAARAIEAVNQGHGTLLESNLDDPRPRGPVRRMEMAAAHRRKFKKGRAR